MIFSLADGSLAESKHKGFIKIGDIEVPAMTIENLQTPLISVNVLAKNGFTICFNEESVFAIPTEFTPIFPNSYMWKIGEIAEDCTYRLTDDAFKILDKSVTQELKETLPKLLATKDQKFTDLPSKYYTLSDSDKAVFQIHIKLGHMSTSQMLKQKLITSAQKHILKDCPQCLIYRHRRKPVITKSHPSHSQKPHTRLFADVYYSDQLFAGIPSYNKKYVVVMVDEFSHYVHTATCTNRMASECSGFINKVLVRYNIYHGHKALELRCDRGTEFAGINRELIQDERLTFAPTNDKERNGLAERFVGIHKQMRLLVTAHVPQPLAVLFFDLSVNHTTLLMNHTLRKESIKHPYDLYHNTDKRLPENLPMFLEDVLVMVTKNNKQKQVLGSFGFYDPHSSTALVLIPSEQNDYTFRSLSVALYHCQRVGILHTAKKFISPEFWKRNESVWGNMPTNWESTCIDLNTNKSFSIEKEISLLEKLDLNMETLTTKEINVCEEAENIPEEENSRKRRKIAVDNTVACPDYSIFKDSLAIVENKQLLSLTFNELSGTHFKADTFSGNHSPTSPEIDLQSPRPNWYMEYLNALHHVPVSQVWENGGHIEEFDSVTLGQLMPVIHNLNQVSTESVFSLDSNPDKGDDQLDIIQYATCDYYDAPKKPKIINNNIKGPWREPIQKEKQKYINMKVFKAAKSLPKDAVLLRPLWVHTVKPNNLKSRMVCFNPKTVHQKVLMTSAPVISSNGINILLSLAATQGLVVQFFDIDNAFLYADMPPGKYFIRTPPLFQDVFKSDYVELVKSTYGLQESPRAFYDHLSKRLTDKLGFKRNKMEPCLFHKGSKLIISIHVDDGAIMGTQEDINDFFNQLSGEFSFKKSESSYLGVDFNTLPGYNTTDPVLLPTWNKIDQNKSAIHLKSSPNEILSDPTDPFVKTQFEELSNPDPTPPKTAGYGKFKILPEAYKSTFKDIETAFSVPDLPDPGTPVFSVSTKTHISKFLNKFYTDYPEFKEFMDYKNENYDKLLHQFAMPPHRELQDFVSSLGAEFGIPDKWKHLPLDKVKSRSLVGSLAYFIYRTISALCFPITVLSRYNTYQHKAINYLILCVIRQVKNCSSTLQFYRPKESKDYVDLILYSDASYNQYGKYYKGTSITLNHSPILFKASTGRNKGHANSTTSVELEAAYDTFKIGSKIKNTLLDMDIKVNMFLHCDNLPLLRLLHHNSETDITVANGKTYDLRDAITSENIKAGFVSGRENPADIYTKPFTNSAIQTWSTLDSNHFVDWNSS